MTNPTIAVVAIWLVCIDVTAQGTNVDQKQPPSTVGLFVELGGFINALSFNLDYQYTYQSDNACRDQIGMRVGYGIFLYNLKTVPVLLIGSIGSNHRFEYGAGAVATPFGIPREINLSETLLKPAISGGWRFEETGAGWLLRGVITVMYDTGQLKNTPKIPFLPLFGISVGYNFQFE